MTARLCRCGAKLGDEFLCGKCTSKLHGLLTNLPHRIAEAEDTAYRLDQITQPGGGAATRGRVRPLPYVPHVTAKLDEARGLLVSWAREIHTISQKEQSA